jgi:transporter family-2 protein
MDKGLAVILTAVVGALIALQAPINAGLGKATGSFPAALISFTIGVLVLLAIVVVSGQASAVGEATEVRWYYLLGGVLGAVYVTAALITVPTIGAGGVAAGTITGQLIASVALDRAGVLGLEEAPITLERALGVGLLLAGTFLIVR